MSALIQAFQMGQQQQIQERNMMYELQIKQYQMKQIQQKQDFDTEMSSLMKQYGGDVSKVTPDNISKLFTINVDEATKFQTNQQAYVSKQLMEKKTLQATYTQQLAAWTKEAQNITSGISDPKERLISEQKLFNQWLKTNPDAVEYVGVDNLKNMLSHSGQTLVDVTLRDGSKVRKAVFSGELTDQMTTEDKTKNRQPSNPDYKLTDFINDNGDVKTVAVDKSTNTYYESGNKTKEISASDMQGFHPVPEGTAATYIKSVDINGVKMTKEQRNAVARNLDIGFRKADATLGTEQITLNKAIGMLEGALNSKNPKLDQNSLAAIGGFLAARSAHGVGIIREEEISMLNGQVSLVERIKSDISKNATGQATKEQLTALKNSMNTINSILINSINDYKRNIIQDSHNMLDLSPEEITQLEHGLMKQHHLSYELSDQEKQQQKRDKNYEISHNRLIIGQEKGVSPLASNRNKIKFLGEVKPDTSNLLFGALQ